MAVTLFDARAGAPAELRPAAPPKVLLCLGPAAGAREEHAHRLLWRVLEHNGFTLSRLMAVDENASKADVAVAGEQPRSGLWVRPAPIAAKELPEPQARRDKGFLEADFHLLMVKTHYRTPVRFSWEALAAAREERLELASIAKSLAGAPAEASSRGLVGYSHRFRDCLGKDLDVAGALGALWDGLKPGALSPGSRAGLLRAADPVLGLGLFTL
jgi:hypothetical protein